MQLLLCLFLMVYGCLARHHQTNQLKSLGFENNFLSVNTVSNGQHERRLVYDGIAAKETYVTARNNNEQLALWQVTDGSHFIQSIYYGEELQDCEHVTDPEEVSKFLKEFEDDDEKLQFVKLNPEVSMDVVNVSRRVLDNEDPPEDMQRMLHLHLLRRQCDEKHEQIKADTHIEDQQLINEFDTGSSRQKRSLSIFPGTKWCGPGNLPLSLGTDPLGGRNHADRCCRRHDNCPYNIKAFKSKYGIRNLGLNTISHCSCDFRFRGCLRSLEGKVGSLIGGMFFNVLKMKCFLLERKRVCVERNTQGICLKKEWRKIAKVVEQAPY